MKKNKLNSVFSLLSLTGLLACSTTPKKTAEVEIAMEPERFPAAAATTKLLKGSFRTPPKLISPYWPQWSHEHWVWENEGTEDSAQTMVEDYLSRDIPVSALVIDRPWDTTPSTFVPDPARYPNLQELINNMHDKNIKVMLWSVPILNEIAPEFEMAKKNNFLVNGARTFKWWGGRGALLDYHNPKAVEWWHSRMDIPINMGIDGWKLDAGDPYIIFASEKSDWKGGLWALASILKINKKAINRWNDYRTNYYTDYWKYTNQATGKKTVITARPMDMLEGTSFQFPFAPREVSFAGWVGDQEGNWSGIKIATANMKESVKRKFLSFGSDIAGFKSADNIPASGLRDEELFIRWTQMSAFNSVFENGGSGEHRPWMYSSQVEDIYRKFTKIHQSLVPYIYSSTAWANENGHSVYVNIEDLGVKPKKSRYWDYLLGPNIFVAVIDEAKSTRQINFPPGEWVPWFQPHMVVPGKSMKMGHALDEYPAYIRNGSIIPLLDPDKKDITAWIFPTNNVSSASTPIYYEDKHGGSISYILSGKRMIVNVTNVNLGRIKLNNAAIKKAMMNNGESLSSSDENSDTIIDIDEKCKSKPTCGIIINL